MRAALHQRDIGVAGAGAVSGHDAKGIAFQGRNSDRISTTIEECGRRFRAALHVAHQDRCAMRNRARQEPDIGYGDIGRRARHAMSARPARPTLPC